MSDVFDDLNKILRKDLVPKLVKYFNDPNNKITDNLNEILNDPQALLTDIFDRLSKIKDNNSNQRNYQDIANINDLDPVFEDEYDDLLKRLILIQEAMIQIEQIIKEKSSKYEN